MVVGWKCSAHDDAIASLTVALEGPVAQLCDGAGEVDMAQPLAAEGTRPHCFHAFGQHYATIVSLVEGAFFGLNLAELHIPAKITNLPSALFSYADRVYIHKDVVSADPWIYDLYGGTTIYGYRGTFAETFAATYNLDFVALDAAD